MVLTLCAFVALVLSVARFGARFEVHITAPARTGNALVLHPGQTIQLWGVITDKDPVYPPVRAVTLELIHKGPHADNRRPYHELLFVNYYPISKRFSATVTAPRLEKSEDLLLEVGVIDGAGHDYARTSFEPPRGGEIAVRIE
jgi:hypothetical protein